MYERASVCVFTDANNAIANICQRWHTYIHELARVCLLSREHCVTPMQWYLNYK